jgi:addiction module HigA family antidote
VRNQGGTRASLESRFANYCNCMLRRSWAISWYRREISLKRFLASAKDNIQFASMISGGSALFALRMARRKSRSAIITEKDWLDRFNPTIIVDHAIDRMLNPIHPGEILLEEYLKPLGVSQNKLARSLRITPKTISEIVLGKRGISPEMSIRLGKFFGQSPRFWLNLQTEYDFRCALRGEKQLTAEVRVLKDLVAA